MGMTSPKSNIFIIWIDKKINNPENKDYQKQFRKLDDFEFKFYDNVKEGIKTIKEIKFKKTIIITSGSIYPDFYKEFKDIVNEITIIPKIYIFTANANNFYTSKKDSLPVDDPFYNSGGVFDDMRTLREAIFSSISLSDKHNEEVNKDESKYLKDERFSYDLISNEKELKLPVFFYNYLKTISNAEIKSFNKKIFDDYKNTPIIRKLFSFLVEGDNIPFSIQAKYWLRAYSADSFFSHNINKSLLNKEYNDYLPMIIKLYEAVSNNYIQTEKSQLYKGIIASKTYLSSLLNKKKEAKLPIGILYGISFFSFYKDKSLSLKLKENNKSILKGDFIFISLILEETSNFRMIKSNADIKDISFFESDKEVIFFPFSCFEIESVEKNTEEEYTITLCYLDKYKQLFVREKNNNFKNVPKTEFSEILINSNIIAPKKIIMPDWAQKEENKQKDEDTPEVNNQENSQENASNYTSLMTKNINVNNSYKSTGIISNNIMDIPYNNSQSQFQSINSNDYFPNFVVLNSIENSSLLENVKSICIRMIKYMQSINNSYNNDLNNIGNNILNQLSNGIGGYWYVNVNYKLLTDFGNINRTSVMIFKYNDLFIHVAQLN